ncbi:gametocyte-specific factor 1-like [Dugong dugon]
MEPEALEICPYDPNHRMPASRLHYHLASCRKKNPKIDKKMANCKYNARHVVPLKRLKEHEVTCVNRTTVDDVLFNLPKVISPILEPNEKLSNAADQIPNPDVWKADNTHPFLSFVKNFAPKMLACENDSRDLKKEATDDKHPNNCKSWRKGRIDFLIKYHSFNYDINIVLTNITHVVF